MGVVYCCKCCVGRINSYAYNLTFLTVNGRHLPLHLACEVANIHDWENVQKSAFLKKDSSFPLCTLTPEDNVNTEYTEDSM